MGKVQLKIPPSLASIVDTQAADWVTFEREISEGTTIGDLLSEFAFSYLEFRTAVFDPDAKKVGDEVMIVLNDSLLPLPGAAEARLNDGDRVILLPVYSGG